jgi:uncharacterized membrane protein
MFRLEDKVAKAVGSWAFLLGQTVVISLYIAFNTLTPQFLHFDPFPFTFLNVILSLQAAYTAPILLLSHNRMAEADRELAQQDRQNTKAILNSIKKLEKTLINAIEEIDDDEKTAS